MPQESQLSYTAHSCLTLMLLVATMLMTLSSCNNDGLISRESTTTQSSAASDKIARAGDQIAGVTIHETITATGDEPQNNYRAISTVINVPSSLSDATASHEIKQDRRKLYSALQTYKQDLNANLHCFDSQFTISAKAIDDNAHPQAPCRFLNRVLTIPYYSYSHSPGTSTQYNLCDTIPQRSDEASATANTIISSTYHHLLKKYGGCRQSTLIRQDNYLLNPASSSGDFWGRHVTHYGQPNLSIRPLGHYNSYNTNQSALSPIHDHFRLRVIMDTLEFFDQTIEKPPLYDQTLISRDQELYLTFQKKHAPASKNSREQILQRYNSSRKVTWLRAIRVFKETADRPSILRVILNLAYTDTEIDDQTVSEKIISTYGKDSLPSFLFFTLLNEPKPNLQAITGHLGGQAFIPALGQQHHESDTDHPITTAMKTITHSTKIYAQGIKLTTEHPVIKVNSITTPNGALRSDEYTVLHSAIYVANDVKPSRGDTIEIDYVAAANP